MKIKITKEQLSPVLAHVSGVVPRKAAMPILSNILMVAQSGRLTITGGAAETSMSATVEAEVIEDGAITVPARKLMDIVKASDKGANLSMTLGEKMTIRTGKSRFTLSTLPADEYPSRSAADGKIIAMPSESLKTLLDATSFAVAQQDVRYYLNGLHMVVTNGELHAVGTDGHRLATASIEIGADDISCTIPRDAIIAASKLIAGHDGQTKIKVAANSIDFDIDGFTLTSNVIDGKFPEWQKVIPTSNHIKAVVDADELRGAMSRAAILSNDKYKGVRLHLEKGSITLTANNPEQEEAEESLEVDYNGEPVEIGFNVAYMLEALGAIESQHCTIELKDSNTAALVTPDDDSGAVYVVMPMRL